MKNNYTNNSSQNSNFAHGPGDRDRCWMGAKIQTQKIPWTSNKTPKKSLDQNLTPQKIPCWISEPYKFPESIEWYDTKNRKISFKYPQKIESSSPKNYLPKFSYPKNPEIENFKPQKILRSSLSLEIWRIPPGHIRHTFLSICTIVYDMKLPNF